MPPKFPPFFHPFFSPLNPKTAPRLCFGNPPSPDSKSLPENRSKCPRPDKQVTFKRWTGNSSLLGFWGSPPWSCCSKGKNSRYSLVLETLCKWDRKSGFCHPATFWFPKGVYSKYSVHMIYMLPIIDLNEDQFVHYFGGDFGLFLRVGLLTATLCQDVWISFECEVSHFSPVFSTIESHWTPVNPAWANGPERTYFTELLSLSIVCLKFTRAWTCLDYHLGGSDGVERIGWQEGQK